MKGELVFWSLKIFQKLSPNLFPKLSPSFLEQQGSPSLAWSSLRMHWWRNWWTDPVPAGCCGGFGTHKGQVIPVTACKDPLEGRFLFLEYDIQLCLTQVWLQTISTLFLKHMSSKGKMCLGYSDAFSKQFEENNNFPLKAWSIMVVNTNN